MFRKRLSFPGSSNVFLFRADRVHRVKDDSEGGIRVGEECCWDRIELKLCRHHYEESIYHFVRPRLDYSHVYLAGRNRASFVDLAGTGMLAREHWMNDAHS